MKKLKKLLGFNSPYSWSKWLRIGGVLIFTFFLIYALVEKYAYPSGGILLFISDYGQNILLYMVLATGAGAVASVVRSLIKQAVSFNKTKKSDSAEMIKFAKRRTTVMLLNFLFPLSAVLGIAGLVIENNNPYSIFDKIPMVGDIYIDYNTCLLIYIIICVLITSALWLIGVSMNRRYAADFKEQIVKKGFESVFNNVDFQPKKSLDESDVRASGLYNTYVRFKGGDYLSGEYNGKRFIQSDIHLQEKRVEEVRGEDGKYRTETSYPTIFKGLFMIFDYDAISDEPLIIYSREQNYSPPYKNKIKTEFDAFNRKFHASADDVTGAFRILTPQVLEGIMAAGKKLECPLALSFKNDKLYVAVSNGNSFEANSYGNDTFTEQLDRLRGEIQTVLDVIQILYLKK